MHNPVDLLSIVGQRAIDVFMRCSNVLATLHATSRG